MFEFSITFTTVDNITYNTRFIGTMKDLREVLNAVHVNNNSVRYTARAI